MRSIVAILVLFLAIYSRGAFVPGVTTTNLPLGQVEFVYTNSFISVSAGTGNTPNAGANFGPDTPGTTTSGINEAIHAATNGLTSARSGGRLVLLSAGVYQCSGQILFPNQSDFQLTLQGNGPGSTFILYTNTTVQDFLMSENNTGNAESNRTFFPVIRDCTIAYDNDTNKAILIHFANIHRLLLDNVRICAWRSFFTNGIFRANQVDSYPTNNIGIIGVKVENQALNNTIIVQNCFFNALAVGLILGGDHNRVRDCFFSNIGYNTVWTTIPTNNMGAARPWPNVIQTNQYAVGAAIIADNPTYETMIEDCEWYKCKAGVLSDCFPSSVAPTIMGYSQFEQVSNRVVMAYYPAANGVEGDLTLPVPVIRTASTVATSDGSGTDAYVSLTNGVIKRQVRSVATPINTELKMGLEPTYSTVLTLGTNGCPNGDCSVVGFIPTFAISQDGSFVCAGGIDVGVDVVNNFNFGGSGTIYLNPSGAFSAGSGTFTVSSSGNVAAPNINVPSVQTNWISGALYTNTSAQDWLVRASAKLTTAAVTGDSAMRLQTSVQGGSLATLSACEMQTTVAVTIAMVYTNEIAGFIPANNVFTFTNLSSGAGNTATLLAGTGQKKQF